ncbi:MAG: FAD-binding protein [Rhizobacter sp.]|nr:FAD-binding protein [Ferruginibacter sp.]
MLELDLNEVKGFPARFYTKDQPRKKDQPHPANAVATGHKKWTNRPGSFTQQIDNLFVMKNEYTDNLMKDYNNTTIAFQNFIKQAIDQDKSVRAVGAGWSFSKVAVTDGWLLDSKQLNMTFSLSSNSIDSNYKVKPDQVLFLQCGNEVWELNKFLQEKKKSLKTTGASNGVTIVGAMSTGTHGSSIDVGAVQDYVVGLHIIVGPKRHVWLERKSAPVVTASFIQKLDTELIQDDDLFNAALVNFGSFGIIHGVLVETEDLFLLETYMRRMPYNGILKKLMKTLDFSKATLPCGNERPFHFAVIINPFDVAGGAFVSTFYKRPYREDYPRPVPNNDGIGPGDDATCFIGRITNIVPALVPTVINKLVDTVLKPFEKKMGTLGEIFNNTTLHGKVLSAAIGIPINETDRVTELLFEINKTDGPFPGLFTYRFIKKSQATLAFTHFDFTCILELDGANSDATKKFFKAVWKRLEKEKVPFTFHWGKLNELDFGRIKRMYGKDADAWISARNKMLDVDTRKVFSNPLLKQWGLDKAL